MKHGGVLLICLLGAMAPARADSDQDAARRAVADGKAIPFERILERVRRDHPGQVLGTELESEGGRMIYELRILGPGGRITEWRYDAGTGKPVDRQPHHGREERD